MKGYSTQKHVDKKIKYVKYDPDGLLRPSFPYQW